MRYGVLLRTCRFWLAPLCLWPFLHVCAQDEAEILWDSWGVPHIYAESTESLFYAFGWAQLQSHGDLILRLYAQARGEMAAHAGEAALESDIVVHTLGLPEVADAWYAAQDERFRGYLDAFAAGMNAYAEAHPERLAETFRDVLPVTGRDPVALIARNLQMIFVSGAAFGQIGAWEQSEAGALGPERNDLEFGSNAWAVAPERSASGNTLLVANPHLAWSDLFLWYEAQLVSPEVNVYGATLVGLPVITIGFNAQLGWTHTVNTYDGYDLYELALTEGGGYVFGTEERLLEASDKTLLVRQEDGSVREHPLTVYTSAHGPVVAQREDRALALRIAARDHAGVLEQWFDMGRAENLEAFEEVMARLQLTMFTVMYADRDGNIMHLFNGAVPVRAQGDFAFWSRILPGDDPELLWEALHPYEDLPKVVNPASGWLQNANDPPWTTTFPLALEPGDYPAYMAPPPATGFRSQRSARLMLEDDDVTFQELVAYKLSTRLELAERLLPELLTAARIYGDDGAREAARVLAAWDRKAEPESRGAVLFVRFYDTLWDERGGEAGIFSEPYDPDALPLTTPRGLAEPEAAVHTLSRVAAEVEAAYGALDVPWGEVYRLRLGDYDLPGHGGDGYLGIFRVTDYREAEEGRYQAAAGDSFVAVIEFADPLRAQVLTSYGNATQAHSPHVGDQLPLYSRGELRDAWLTREAVEANLSEQEVLRVR